MAQWAGPGQPGPALAMRPASPTSRRATPMNLLTTFAGSLMEGFLPRGWDLARIDACCAQPPQSIAERQPWWHAALEPVRCGSIADFDVMLGHEIAAQVRRTRDAGRDLALILPV